MLRLTKKGIGSTELLVSVFFLLIMGIYSWKILERQKVAVIVSNQNIEIVDLVNSMRKVLAAPNSCRASFEDMLHNQDAGEIDSLIEVASNGQENEVYTISAFDEEKIYGKHGLKIKSYELKKSGLGEEDFEFGTYLVVTFSRSFEDRVAKKAIKLFTKEVDGRITDCSLGYTMAQNSGVWEIEKNGDASTRKRVIVGKEEINDDLPWLLAIEGALQLFPTEGSCANFNEGSIFVTGSDLRVCSGGISKQVFEFGGIY